MPGPVVLITRERDKAVELAELVSAMGGAPVVFPTIETRMVKLEPVEFSTRLERSAWVVFTSERGVRYTFEVLGDLGAGIISKKKVAAVGKKTASALFEKGIGDVFVPEVRDGASLARELVPLLGKEDVVFFPRAKMGREELIEVLERNGVTVDCFDLYETVAPSYSREAVEELIGSKPDYAVFTSPSTFENLFVILGDDVANRFLRNVKIAVIGRTTGKAVEERGFQPSVMPEAPSAEGLIRAIFDDYAGKRRNRKGG